MPSEQVERLLGLRRLLGGAPGGQNREKFWRRPFGTSRSDASRSRRALTVSRSFARIAAPFRKSSKVGDLRSISRDVTRRRRERFRRRTKPRLGSTLSRRFGTPTFTRKRSLKPPRKGSNAIRFKTSPRKPPRSLTALRRVNDRIDDAGRRRDKTPSLRSRFTTSRRFLFQRRPRSNGERRGKFYAARNNSRTSTFFCAWTPRALFSALFLSDAASVSTVERVRCASPSR